MEQKTLETLFRIYNTLCLIETKGENTIIMADCLKSLKTIINEEQIKKKEE